MLVVAAVGGFALAGMSDSEGDGAAQRQMLEKRVEITQIALQPATDRLAVAPPK